MPAYTGDSCNCNKQEDVAESPWRRGQATSTPTGILCLDLTEALYRIFRETPLGGTASDEVIAYIMRRLNMPSDLLHQIHQLLQGPCSLTKGGVPEFARNAVQAIHSSTHFWVPGQEDTSCTRMGACSGDPFADWIFGFAWATILKKVQQFMLDNNINEPLTGHDMLPLFGRQAVTDQKVPFVGPNWMDSLAVGVRARSCEELVSQWEE